MILWIILGLLIVTVLMSIRIVPQTRRGVVETFGKFSYPVRLGINFVVPYIQGVATIDITEQMSNVEKQEIITKDNLNADVELVVFYRIKSDEQNVYKALYNVANVTSQIQMLARTTARNVIGEFSFSSVNSQRGEINKKIKEVIGTEVQDWGVDIVRVELKEITPPSKVQETMNQVIIAENAKQSAIDFANAKETEADGIARAEIKKAEGEKRASILKAEGQAQAFELVNKSFTANAQLLRKLEVAENSLKTNTKYVFARDGNFSNVILGGMSEGI